jgi:hypothetical protein
MWTRSVSFVRLHYYRFMMSVEVGSYYRHLRHIVVVLFAATHGFPFFYISFYVQSIVSIHLM